MHALSLYLDTSVIGGYYDAEFLADTRALWQLKKAGRFRFIRCGSDTPKLASAWSAERDVVWIAWGSIKFAEVLSNAPGLAPGIFTSSQLVIDEIAGAPERVRALMQTSFAVEDVLEINDEMEDLVAAYLAQKVVPAGYAADAQHVAICSVARLDYLVSWNFKHLANVRRESGFNAVNVLQGYPPVRIVAPTFLIHGHEEKIL